jgi:hypothetical protein
MLRFLLGLSMAAAAALAAQNSSPVELLQRIRQKMAENLTGLPNYTCRLTVERSRKLKSADRFEPIDTLRLEVALSGSRELYAWPGDSHFEEKRIDEMVPGGGTIGNGDFALHARAVFAGKAAIFTYGGETPQTGRAVVQYHFRIARLKSEYVISNGVKSAAVGYHGSFWVDKETLDLLRLQLQADDIPSELSVSEAEHMLEYQRVRIGEASYLLPRASELVLVDAAGNASRNQTRFSECRQYTGQSVLSFADPSTAPEPAKPAAVVALPSRLTLEIELAAAFEGEGAAVGDPVQARLAHAVSGKEGVLFAKGAPVAGHLTRLEKRNTRLGDFWVVGLEFSQLEGQGRRAEFRASLEDLEASGSQYFLPFSFQAGGPHQAWPALRGQPFPPAPVPGEGVIFVKGSRLRLPPGLRMRWSIEP